MSRRRRSPSPPIIDIFDDDDEGWQDMPVVHQDELRGGLDEEDQKKYHYRPQADTKQSASSSFGGGSSSGTTMTTVSSLNTSGTKVSGNATGKTLDTDERGYRWRVNPMGEKGTGSGADTHDFLTESNYTRLRHVEEDWDEGDQLHQTSQYLFGDTADSILDDRKAMTPLSQMQQTKGLLSDSQKIAYVGLCALVTKQMIREFSVPETTRKKVKVQVRVPVLPEKDDQGGGDAKKNAKSAEGPKANTPPNLQIGSASASAPTEYQWKTETRYEEKPTGKIKKDFRDSVKSMELWALKIMGRLYYHIELEKAEQRMIESLAEHGVQPADLVPALQQMKEVPNPEWTHVGSYSYDSSYPMEPDHPDDLPPAYSSSASDSPNSGVDSKDDSKSDSTDNPDDRPETPSKPAPVPKTIMLDMRFTLLTDLFLILIADSVYDSRSRALLFRVGKYLGLTSWETVLFEGRIVEAVGIQESLCVNEDSLSLPPTLFSLSSLLPFPAPYLPSSMPNKPKQDTAEEGLQQNKDAVQAQVKALRNRRIALLGLATLGGGLVIGLSAGLLAPVIGVGLDFFFFLSPLPSIRLTLLISVLHHLRYLCLRLSPGSTGTAFSTIGITGASTFLAGAGGAAVITTGGVLTGAGIAGKGMHRRTQVVRVFDVLPLHKNGRVGCVLTVPGFLNGPMDDPRLPFSVLDPVIGDVFSVLWEPEMIMETGSEVLSQIGQTVLQATVMATLMTALQWPIILTKLGYLIDNPWSNALDRARAAGLVLASVLRDRQLGVRPVTLIGFSLGARVIFYALLDLARTGNFGIVEDVYLLGATLSVSKQMWEQTRSVVGGRFVNVASSAATGNVNAVAGLRPIQGVEGIENVDVTDKISGHMSYRVYMPVILEGLGFRVTERYFDEVEEPDFEGDRVVITEEQENEKKGWFGRRKKQQSTNMSSRTNVQRPPSYATWVDKEKDKFKSKMNGGSPLSSTQGAADEEDDLPPREGTPTGSGSGSGSRSSTPIPRSTKIVPVNSDDSPSTLPKTAGFDLAAIKAEVEVAKAQGGVELPGGGGGPGRTTAPREMGANNARFDLKAIKDVLDSEGVKADGLHDLKLDVEGVVLPAIETPRIDRDVRPHRGPSYDGEYEPEEDEYRTGDPFSHRADDDNDNGDPPTPPAKMTLYPNGSGLGSGYSNPSSATSVYNPFASAGASVENFSLPNTFGTIPSSGLGSGFGSSFGFGNGGGGGISFGGADGSISLGSPDPWAAPAPRREDNNPWG
ncbi:hypothetical protein D9757_012593 [Collybiopsis confluens]|uniref:DUF726-domain-containing protein n=1 Tax=Collybiopsis confluens TaxID=2823264 RepID=A0A8H5CZ96_9AGAR|nr:hypothetical protein D9757_012593 [Collybiopsis confluens]